MLAVDRTIIVAGVLARKIVDKEPDTPATTTVVVISVRSGASHRLGMPEAPVIVTREMHEERLEGTTVATTDTVIVRREYSRRALVVRRASANLNSSNSNLVSSINLERVYLLFHINSYNRRVEPTTMLHQ